MSGLDRDRPLWTITVVEGLQRGQAAVIIKMSHVMTDGVGSLAVLALLGDLTREATRSRGDAGNPLARE